MFSVGSSFSKMHAVPANLTEPLPRSYEKAPAHRWSAATPCSRITVIDLSRWRHEYDFVWNDIICSELFVLKVIWKNPMDGYNGSLNFLAAVCVALLFFVVVLGHSRHDTGQRSAVKNVSIEAPVTAPAQ